MPTAQVEAFATVRATLQNMVAATGARLWDGMAAHNREDVPAFLNTLLPVLGAGQQQVITLTDAYLALRMDRRPLGVPVEDVVAGVRGDVDPADVYLRPFITLWGGLKQGRPWEVASDAARARLEATLKTDVMLAMRGAMAAVDEADPNILGFERVIRGTCDLCIDTTGHLTNGAQFPVHPGCECVGDPVTARSARATREPRGTTVVREHGELGALLVAGEQHFTEKEDLETIGAARRQEEAARP